MAAVGPAQGTSMGSRAPLNTSSSVTGATTWFLSHTASPTHSLHDWTSGDVKSRIYDGVHIKYLNTTPTYEAELTQRRLQLPAEAFRVVHRSMNQGAEIKYLTFGIKCDYYIQWSCIKHRLKRRLWSLQDTFINVWFKHAHGTLLQNADV